MFSRKVLIADPTEEFADALILALGSGIETLCCSRGEQALELVDSWKPDVLVLELCVHGLDGLGVLRALTERASRPRILVVSAMLTDFVLYTLEGLGVQYALRKPCCIPAAAERVEQLLQSAWCRRDTPAERLLINLGISSARQGYPYLVTALELLTRHRDQRLSKELYEGIALQYRTSVAGVEKAIRDAIVSGWKSGDPAFWQQCFPGARRYPPNKEFLFRLADLLSEQKRCG